MSGKIKSYKSSKSLKHQRERRQDLPDNAVEQEVNHILGKLYESPQPLSAKQIAATKTEGFDSTSLQQALRYLEHEGLIRAKGARYAIHPKAPLYTGQISQNRRGVGFLEAQPAGPGGAKLNRDLFLSPSNLAGAMHGDIVLARRLKETRGRIAGRVIAILQRKQPEVSGIIRVRKKEAYLVADDGRFPFRIHLHRQPGFKLQEGEAAIVSYRRTDNPRSGLSGEIVRLLGNAEDIATQTQLVLYAHNLQDSFPPAVEQEAQTLAGSFAADSRLDLREILHITVDGESAKDFDDAISIQKTRSGFRLYVSIADVSYFVRPGSAIDREAYCRGTSVYFPHQAIPMLPEKLSHDLCSLLPGKDRYTVSAILDFDRAGNLKKKSFARSIIHSQRRFTYNEVKRILVDRDPKIRRQNKKFLTPLKWAAELTTALGKKRRSRGAIEFELTAPFFALNEQLQVQQISKQERNFAHQIIEECMIAANEAVAALFAENKVKALFRTHESPKEEEMDRIMPFISSLGLRLEPFDNTPAWYANILRSFANSRYQYIVNSLLLRTLQQAKYTADNIGHFGLASACYTHFTSPIRRYPDLLAHRQLLDTLGRDNLPAEKKGDRVVDFSGIGAHCSALERQAVTAERDMADRLKILYMQDKRGERFTAIISGISDTNLFVEIEEIAVSGVIPISSLTDDLYLHDRDRYRLFGEITAKTYQIGDRVQVELKEVNTVRRWLDFAIVDA